MMPTMFRLTGTKTPENVPIFADDRGRLASRASVAKPIPRCNASADGAGGRSGERSEGKDAMLPATEAGAGCSSSSRSGEFSRYRDVVRGRGGRPGPPSPVSVGARRLSCCCSASTPALARARKRDESRMAPGAWASSTRMQTNEAADVSLSRRRAEVERSMCRLLGRAIAFLSSSMRLCSRLDAHDAEADRADRDAVVVLSCKLAGASGEIRVDDASLLAHAMPSATDVAASALDDLEHDIGLELRVPLHGEDADVA